jgi:adenylate cyclase
MRNPGTTPGFPRDLMEALVTFGNFRFEPASARLWENDAEIRLTRKAAQVLAMLVEHSGAPVSKQALFDQVWRGTVVSDDALVTCIQELRKALHDDDRHYIETRHRHGYLFAAPVTSAPAAVDSSAAPAPAAEASTIAVMPFADMSPERDQDYLCEGLAEELIDALTHIEGLRVAARTSAFQFRGFHDLREVGRKLGVGTLLEGSVRKAGERLRITVQLIDVATGFHKWSERFDRSAADVFAVQDEIAETVATLLRGGELNARERRAVRRQPTAIETYECFLRGRQSMHNWGKKGFDDAQEYFERAIALDAGYAPAWAGLATVHAARHEWFSATDDNLREADRASRIAMELAPGLADAQLARGYTLSNLRRYDEARPHFEAAAAINPNLFDAYYYYGRAAFAAGEHEKAIEVWRKAAEIRREDFESPMFVEQTLRKLGRLEEARAANLEALRRVERLVELNPMNSRALSLGSGTLHADGQHARALEWVRRAEAIEPDDMAVIINGALLRGKLGMKDEAIDMLERVFGAGRGKKEWVEQDPDYDPLREDPRFKAMLEKLK